MRIIELSLDAAFDRARTVEKSASNRTLDPVTPFEQALDSSGIGERAQRLMDRIERRIADQQVPQQIGA